MTSTMNKPGSRRNDPSSVFGKVSSCTSQPKTRESESILHRLNNLSVLINSSYIDLNIAFNDGDATNGEGSRRKVQMTSSVTKNGKLTSLSSQSTKRRSLSNNSKLQGNTIRFTDESKSLTGGSAYFGRDGLIDAFLALYDECCTNDEYKRDPLILEFIQKYSSYVSHLSKLCVSLNDFESLNIIGKGHFAVVKLVREKTSSQCYALKTLKKNDTLRQKHVAFYEEERDIMAKATSPWITKLQYAFQDHENLYLVMEYHPGGDLLSLLERATDGILDEKSVAFYLSQTATGLNHLHNMGYVHRDIKPENLLLDRCGHIKLADFGSACKLDDNGEATAQMPAGTPDYLAPELLMAMEKNGGYGVLCDFWSLGVVAYEMLFGVTPFKSDRTSETYSNIMQHSTKLKIPDDSSIGKEAVSLIKALLVDVGKRLNYQSLTKHAFFLHTNWNSLIDSVPPFIPNISGAEDISNFDSFDEASTSILTDSSYKGTSLGTKVPFVGFTYSRVSHNAIDADKKSECSEMSISEAVAKLQVELKEKKKTIHDLQMKAKEQGSSDKERIMNEEKNKTKLNQLEKEKSKLQDQIIEMEGSLASFKHQLSSEKAERATMESKTLSLIKDIKSKWKKEEEEKIAQIAEKCELLEEAAHREREAHSDTLVKHKECLMEISTLEKQVLQYRKLAHNKDKEVKKLEAAAMALEEQVTSISNSSVDEEQFTIVRRELNKLQTETDTLRRERDELRLRVNESEDKLLTQENTLAQLKTQCDLTETKAFEDMEKMNATHDKVLSVKDSLIKELKAALQTEKGSKETLQTQLSSATEKLTSSSGKISLFEKDIDRIVQRHGEERKRLETTVQELTRKLQEKEQVLSDCTLVKERLQCRVSDMERCAMETSQLQERSSDSKLNDELQSVREQLQSTKEKLVREEERKDTALRDLQAEKDTLARVQLDMRLSNKNSEDLKEKITFLRECYREAREETKTIASSVETKEEEIEALKKEKTRLKEEVKAFSTKTEELEKSHKASVDLLHSRIGRLEESLKERDALAKKLSDAQMTIDQSKLSKRGIECTLEQEKQIRLTAEQEAQKVKMDLKALTDKITALEKSNTQLKELCSEQDEQLSELDSIESKIQEHQNLKKALQEQISKLEAEVKAARTQVNEEKSLKMFQERQVKNLQNQLKGTEEQTDKQVSGMQRNVEEIAMENLKLSDKITELEHRLLESERDIASLEQQKEDLKCEAGHLKEQSAGHITHIHALKDSNFQLTQGLEEAIDKGVSYKKMVEEVTLELSQEKQISTDRDMRNKMTLEQQAKLIDFLQAKLDDIKKKKTLSSKLFGRDKENNPDTLTPYKTRSNLLQKEGETPVRRPRVKEPCSVETPRDRTVSTERCHLYRSEQRASVKDKQRIRHNIPHRFERCMLVHGGTCSGCQSSLARGRFGYKCSHCSATAHKHCFPGVPSTCGLPVELARHFSRDEDPQGVGVVHEGWVKVEMKGVWWFCFARITVSGELFLYDHEPSEETCAPPQHTLPLLSGGDKVEIVTAVTTSEVPATSNLDLPFVIKVEVVRGPLQNVQRVYLMTTNYEQKQKWVGALEQTLCNNSDDITYDSDDGSVIEVKELLCTDSLKPKSLIYISKEVALLGTAEGLFSCTISPEGSLLKKVRLGTLSNVHQILSVPSIGQLLVIAGVSKQCFMFPLPSLLTAASHCSLDEPSLCHSDVTALTSVCCHLLAMGVTSDQRTFVCAAAQDRICILLWSSSSDSLEMVRQYGTQEPCSSCLFTPAALIVAADKLYEIDLNTFTIEEFLDESDTSLAYAIYGTTHIESYPLSVLQISESGKYGEFLVVFSEFGLFVDPYGRRSREHDIKFTRRPTDVVYVKGVLYLLYSNAVEAIEIRGDSFTKVTSSESQDFDASSSIGGYSSCASTKLITPEVIGVTADQQLVVSELKQPKHWRLLGLRATFPLPDQMSSWSSLPSTIAPPGDRARNSDETTSLSEGESSSQSAKRKDIPFSSTKQVHFTPKRSRRN